MHELGLGIHIVGGGIALLAGGVALGLRKGGRSHVRAGAIFFAAMLVLTASGAILAALRPERVTAMIGLFTFYLVATSWMAARRDGVAGRFELGAFVFAAGCAATLAAMGMMAAASPSGRLDSLPAAVPFGFGTLAALAALLDLNHLLRRRLTARQRVARHLWRMCAALLIATSSFFLGQQDEFPDAVQGSGIFFLPVLAVLAAMIFWIFRVRFARSWGRPAHPRAARSGSVMPAAEARAGV